MRLPPPQDFLWESAVRKQELVVSTAQERANSPVLKQTKVLLRFLITMKDQEVVIVIIIIIKAPARRVDGYLLKQMAACLRLVKTVS